MLKGLEDVCAEIDALRSASEGVGLSLRLKKAIEGYQSIVECGNRAVAEAKATGEKLSLLAAQCDSAEDCIRAEACQPFFAPLAWLKGLFARLGMDIGSVGGVGLAKMVRASSWQQAAHHTPSRTADELTKAREELFEGSPCLRNLEFVGQTLADMAERKLEVDQGEGHKVSTTYVKYWLVSP